MTKAVRSTAPEPLGAIPFNIPEPTRHEISNGMSVVLLEDKRNPLVSFRLAIASGETVDPVDKTGLSGAVAALLNEGTETMSSREIADEIELIGTSISVSAGYDNTVVKAQTLSKFSSRVLELMSEIMLKPIFPQSELDLYKENTIESLKFQRSQPDFLSEEQMARELFGDHPYGISSPTEENIKNITRDDLANYHAKWYLPNNAIFFAVGDFNSEELISQLESTFKDWTPGEIENLSLPPIRKRTNRNTLIVHRPGSTQVNMLLGNQGMNANDPDMFAAMVLNQVLGSGASSRLFLNLREEKGYTYGAYSRFYKKKHAGSFEMSAEVRNDVVGVSLKEFLKEAESIRTELVSEKEIRDAKQFICGVFPLRAETISGLSGLIVSQFLNGFPDDYLKTYRENIQKVTREDVLKAAQKYIKIDKMALVVVGDAKDVLPQVEDYSSDIVLLDSEGNEIAREDLIVSEDAPTADLSGTWNVKIDAQGQSLPVKLVIEQNGNALSGKLESMLGEGDIKDGSVTGNTFVAKVSSEFQGQAVELSLNGSLTGENIVGFVSTPMFPEPLSFTGERNA